jgi:hypothetical protein
MYELVNDITGQAEQGPAKKKDLEKVLEAMGEPELHLGEPITYSIREVEDETPAPAELKGHELISVPEDE